jgi:hypothetical protein
MSRKGASSATEWRAKADAQREAQAVPLELPSGATVMVSRPPIALWVAHGRIPQTLTEDLHRVFVETEGDPDEVEEAFEEIGEKRSGAILVFMRDAVKAACVKPRIVETPASEEEISPADIPLEDFSAIFAWVIQGSPSVPVKTADGEVSVQSLRNFRQRGGAAKPPRARKSRGKVRKTAKRTAGD